jgi:transposase
LVEKKGLTVTEACRRMNVPTSQYYRLKKQMETEGEAALHQVDKKNRVALNELSNEQKKAVMGVVGKHPEFGPTRIAEHIKKESKGAMALDGKLVYQYLKRKGLNTESRRKAIPKPALTAFEGTVIMNGLRFHMGMVTSSDILSGRGLKLKRVFSPRESLWKA